MSPSFAPVTSMSAPPYRHQGAGTGGDRQWSSVGPACRPFLGRPAQEGPCAVALRRSRDRDRVHDRHRRHQPGRATSPDGIAPNSRYIKSRTVGPAARRQRAGRSCRTWPLWRLPGASTNEPSARRRLERVLRRLRRRVPGDSGKPSGPGLRCQGGDLRPRPEVLDPPRLPGAFLRRASLPASWRTHRWLTGQARRHAGRRHLPAPVCHYSCQILLLRIKSMSARYREPAS